MKIFRVNVDGQEYTVKVEELSEPAKEISNAAFSTVEPKDRPPEKEKVNNPQVPEKEPPDKPKPASGNGFTVKAPMPGSVIEVKVKIGDAVSEGDVLLVLEAMKMENELTASRAGSVTEILVKKGDTVNSGDPLLTLS